MTHATSCDLLVRNGDCTCRDPDADQKQTPLDLGRISARFASLLTTERPPEGTLADFLHADLSAAVVEGRALLQEVERLTAELAEARKRERGAAELQPPCSMCSAKTGQWISHQRGCPVDQAGDD